ncbi:hypothetical protein BST27_12990 [Mycobacterium intermedium]|uniref:ANTAR domain-containing protein n=1 Tax=Mycobacterium intermedium TaxID=28445 RepID=A0A1E3SAA6_MYCIE|nr:ANTAR domain-containing protein [Mycobacterium intermedium]MCV6964247.1 ANTAR domain-containing protein [Mycobacterium intermedium]ODQ99024.1 hypothetical protein BHQ20_19425 [Mycobacterium intermedium]OPE46412.1 hypothetical protein BV508_26015 [Mycobacterium intermedium]ORB05311.1 hypothetical protein BST27_12990 [Mycobacterium intermedium]
MTQGLESHTTIRDRRNGSTRALDTAVGILVGWRRCSTYTAFRELVSASERHGIPVFALAGALVNLASRDDESQPADTPAQLAAEREWGAQNSS